MIKSNLVPSFRKQYDLEQANPSYNYNEKQTTSRKISRRFCAGH